MPAGQIVEETTYPRPGDPNPKVRLGVVGAAMLVLLAAGSIAVPILVK